GLNHEQQQQELIVTDIKHVFSANPLRPAYDEAPSAPPGDAPPLRWVPFDVALHDCGHGGDRFAYDNGGPRHRAFLHAFALASRPATNGEYLAFVADGGYRRPELWLSEGWATAQAGGWAEPFYWGRHDDGWYAYTLAGLRPLRE